MNIINNVITIIGVGHVFNIGGRIASIILSRAPDMLCVELDKNRYNALCSRKNRGEAPFVYKLLSVFQGNIAEQYGTYAGEEMITAIETAKKIKSQIAFIDMDAIHVFQRLWSQMRFKEKMKFIIAAIASVFITKKMVEREIKNFEEDSNGYMEKVSTEFPTIKRVLIDERDEYMAGILKKLSEKYNNIIAVVGDGHVDGIKERLSGDVEIIRLSELRSVVEIKQDGVTYSYTFS